MADSPQPTEVVQGTTAGGVGGQTLGQGLVEAIAGAVQTGVAQAMSTANAQMQVQFQALSETVNQLKNQVEKAASTDTDSGYVVRSVVDPEDSHRTSMSYRDMAMADCIEFRKACDALVLRKISQDSDHHSEGHSVPRSSAVVPPPIV